MSKISSPASEDIKLARKAAKMTQSQAASLIHSTMRTWQDWEAGIAKMHPGLWELFQMKVELENQCGRKIRY